MVTPVVVRFNPFSSSMPLVAGLAAVVVVVAIAGVDDS